MAGLSKGEISARHFADLDADASFQIPVNFGDESGNGGGLLLGADDDFDAALAADADESQLHLQLTPTPKRRARPKSRLPVPASASTRAFSRENVSAVPGTVGQHQRTRSFTSSIPVPKSAARPLSLSRPLTQERPKAPATADKSIKRISRPPIKWTEPVAAAGWSSDGDEQAGAASPTPAAPREQAHVKVTERRTSTSTNVSSTSFNLASTSAFPALGDISNIADATNIAASTFANTTQGDDEEDDDDEALLAQLETERMQLRAELDRQRALREAGIRSPAVPANRASPARARLASPARASRIPSRPASPVATTLDAASSTPEPQPAAARLSISSRPPTPATKPARRASRVVVQPEPEPEPQQELDEPAPTAARPPTPPRRQSTQIAPTQPSARASRVIVQPVAQPSSSISPAEPEPSSRRASVRKEPSPPRARRVSTAPTQTQALMAEDNEDDGPEYVEDVPTRAPSPLHARRVSRVPAEDEARDEPPAPARQAERRESVAQAPRASLVSRAQTAPRPSLPAAGRRRDSAAAVAGANDDVAMAQDADEPPSRRAGRESTSTVTQGSVGRGSLASQLQAQSGPAAAPRLSTSASTSDARRHESIPQARRESAAPRRESIPPARRESVAAPDQDDTMADMSMPGGFDFDFGQPAAPSRRNSVASGRESAVARRESVTSRRDSVAPASRRASAGGPARTYADVFDDDDDEEEDGMDLDAASPSRRASTRQALYPTLPDEPPAPHREDTDAMQISPACPAARHQSRTSIGAGALYSPLRSQPLRSPAVVIRRAVRVPMPAPAPEQHQYEYVPSRPASPEPPFERALARSRPASPQYPASPQRETRPRPGSPQYPVARSRPASPLYSARSRAASPQYATRSRPASHQYSYSRPQSRAASPLSRGRASTRSSAVGTAPSTSRPRSHSFAAQQEARVDDMFARRVRDSNSHRGIELSPRSTRGGGDAGYMAPTAASRSRANSISVSRPASPERGREGSRSRPPSPRESRSRSRSRPASPARDRARSQSRQPQATRTRPAEAAPAPRKEKERGGFAAGTAASRQRAAEAKERPLRERNMNTSKSKSRERPPPPSNSVKPASTANPKPAARKPASAPTDPARAVSARTAPKGILKPKAKPAVTAQAKAKERLPPSQFKRALTAQEKAKTKPKDGGKGKENEGEGIADVLAKYGEKLLKASGLAWIAQPEPEPQPKSNPPSSKRIAPPVLPPPPPRSADEADESSAGEEDHDPYRPLTLDDLSPRKRRQALGGLESPMRPAYKRSSDETVTGSPGSERDYKRVRPLPPPSSRTPSPSSPPRGHHQYDEPPPRPASRQTVRRDDPPPRPVSRPASRHDESVRSRAVSRTESTRSAGSRSESRRALEASWDAPGHANRQRVLEKLELDRLRKELEAQARATFVPDYAIAPAQPPVLPRAKPTVTQPFSFASDARARREEFEAKRAMWQQREHESGSVGSSHATSRSRSHLRANPTVPVAPHLSTDVRARERERFNAGVRERERTVEAYREQRRAARAAEEEREYRQMRKRTVVRAHEVPAWYADAPKPKSKRTASVAR